MNGGRKCATLLGQKTRRLAPAAWIRAIAGPMLPRPGVVTYTVAFETARKDAERRRELRRTVHLQSGKILDAEERFLTEFQFKNRTEMGIRLRLAQRVALPKSIFLYDDQRLALVAANVVWQHGSDVGCRVSAKAPPSKEKLLTRLRSPYYAIQ